ncbi:unnamed protein product [Calicophoron daubneyi]|uniref:Headcase middle domain-containing protein n=1 Tax=Calicophoron daubneyi TaxID=300641 RepID=A0AAV2TQE0_CALDB
MSYKFTDTLNAAELNWPARPTVESSWTQNSNTHPDVNSVEANQINHPSADSKSAFRHPLCSNEPSLPYDVKSYGIVPRSPWSSTYCGVSGNVESVGNTDMQPWDAGNQIHNRSLSFSDGQRPSNSANVCAVPAGICHMLQGITTAEGLDSLAPNVYVACATSGCNYGGPVHRACLHRWTSSCELRCRMLASTPLRCSGVKSPIMAESHPNLENLFTLYRCPRCCQCTLCRTTIDPSGHPVTLPDDPHATVLSAVQYANQQLSMNIGSSSLPSAVNFAEQPSQALSGFSYANEKPPTATEESSVSLPNSGNDARSNFVMPTGKRASWNNAWPISPTSQCQTAQHLNQQTQLMRHLSLCQGPNGTSISSGSTSGFGSGTFGSSFSTTHDNSVDSSRRSSNNDAFSSDTSDLSRMEDCSYLSPTSGLVAPRALRGSGGSGLFSTRHSFSGPSRGDAHFTFDPLPPIRSDSPAGPATASSNDTEDIASSVKQPPSPARHSSFSSATEDSCSTMETSSVCVGAIGRRHNSISSTSKGLSFWPTELQKNRSNTFDLGRRKVVNRKGNIFQPRNDFKVFQNLPAYKRNAYFIQMDDDSCTGNEDTRAFLLAQLTNHRVSEVHCLACQKSLAVYDHFPVVDGIFFTSPVCHRSAKGTGLRVSWHTNGLTPAFHSSSLSGANIDPEHLSCETTRKLLGANKPVVPPPGCLGPRQQLNASHAADQGSGFGSSHGTGRFAHSSRQERYLHALCMECLRDPFDSISQSAASVMKIFCRMCNQPWSGSTLLVGGLYTYDVFAAFPCCSDHLTCNACGQCLGSISRANNTTNITQGDRTKQVKLPQRQSCDNQHRINPNPNSQDTNEKENIVRRDNPNTGTIVDVSFPLPFFSQYSQLITCVYCSKVDYHFVKPFDRYYRTTACNM